MMRTTVPQGGFKSSNSSHQSSLAVFAVASLLFLSQPLCAQSTNPVGVTIITHGYQINGSEPPTWMTSMANAVAMRAGGLDKVSQYTMTLNLNDAGTPTVTSFTLDSGSPPLESLATAQVIVKVDWSEISGGWFCNGLGGTPTLEIAQPISAAIISGDAATDGTLPHALAELPIHLIGHSRGASLFSAVTSNLCQQGLWIDHFTSLDPHPCNIDAAVNIYSNVVFADNYYEDGQGFYLDDCNLGPYFPTGEQIDGAFDRQLTYLLGGGYCSYDPVAVWNPHRKVHLWYHGTIDLNTPTDDASGGTITSAERSTWWTPSENEGAAAGFYFSRIAGGPRDPSGVSQAFGGTGARVGVTPSGTQWPNIANLGIADPRFSSDLPAFSVGETIPVTYQYQDYGSSVSVDIYLDLDQNPYNSNSTQISQCTYTATGNKINSGSCSCSTSGMQPGTYYLYASISDGQLTRYEYLNKQVEILSPPQIVSTDPVDGGPMVAQNANIQIHFSEAMDPQTLNGTTVTAVGSVSGVINATYSYANTTLTVSPLANFSDGETVTVTVSGSVRTSQGNELASGYVFQFQVMTGTPTPIIVGGTITNATVWTAGNVYLGTSDVTISAGATLTIQAGTVVKFSNHWLVVNGTLDLQGTATEKVVFTSIRDDLYGGDSNGDGSASTPSPGDWGGIQYSNSANVLHDALVQYGGGSMILVSGPTGGELEIADCVLQYASDYAIYANSNTAPSIHNNTIRACGDGIYLSAGEVVNNAISEHAGWAIYVSGSGTLTIAGNNIYHNVYAVYQGISQPSYSGNAFISNTNTVIGVSGILTTNVVWGNVQGWENGKGLGLPYLVTDEVVIPAGVTLTINAGVVVKFAPPEWRCNPYCYEFGCLCQYYDARLIASGTLQLNSTPNQKIVFTSWRDDEYGGDSNGDGGASQPAPGDWGYIRYDNLTNTLHDVILRYGGFSEEYNTPEYVYHNYMLWVTGSATDALEITNVTLEKSSGSALFVDNSRPMWIHNNTMDGGFTGVQLTNGDNVVIENNVFSNNTSSALEISLGSPIIRDNLLADNGSAIVLDADDSPIVYDNDISGCQGVALSVNASGTAQIYDNYVTDNKGGISLGGTGTALVESNVVSGNQGAGVTVNGPGAPLIQDNTITNNGWGFYISGGSPQLFNNVVDANTYPVYEDGQASPTYAGNTFAKNVNQVLGVGGTLGCDKTWGQSNVQALGYPFLVTSDLTIPAGITLTIEAGTVVKLNGNMCASVSGTLQLNSTPSQPVVFTSYRDDKYGGDSNGDGTNSVPAPGDWGYIRYDSPTNVLHDVIIRYGGGNVVWDWNTWPWAESQMIWAGGSVPGTLEIRNAVIEYAYINAIYADPGQSPWVHDNTVRGSFQGVVGASALVQGNTFSNLSSCAINLSSNATVEGNAVSGVSAGSLQVGGNLFIGLGDGILVGDGTVSNNTITGSSGWAIYISRSGNPTVSGNTISQNVYTVYQGISQPSYSGNTFTSNTNTVIGVGGTLTTNVVWEDVQGLGFPYLIADDVIIPPDLTLTIPAGTVVKFNSPGEFITPLGYSFSSRQLIVSGTLQLNSTPSSKIVFTSYRDDEYGGDSNGDGGASQPAPGDWTQIIYQDPTNTLHDAILRYGGNGGDSGMVLVESALPGLMEIRDCSFQESGGDAVAITAGQVS
ncbi:MAG: NosD domain-containing protein, partial [Verrucomicrobiia bacterium]